MPHDQPASVPVSVRRPAGWPVAARHRSVRYALPLASTEAAIVLPSGLNATSDSCEPLGSAGSVRTAASVPDSAGPDAGPLTVDERAVPVCPGLCAGLKTEVTKTSTSTIATAVASPVASRGLARTVAATGVTRGIRRRGGVAGLALAGGAVPPGARASAARAAAAVCASGRPAGSAASSASMSSRSGPACSGGVSRRVRIAAMTAAMVEPVNGGPPSTAQ